MSKQGSLFTLAGAFVLGLGLWRATDAARSTSWPTVEGQVLSAKVVSSREGGTSKAEVKYKYSVDGVAYENDVVRIGQVYTSSFFRRAKKMTQRYRCGPETIYYNPAAPEMSVLEPGIHGDNYLVPIGGLVFTIAGVLMINHRRKQLAGPPRLK